MSNIINLLKETEEILSDNNLTWDDVIWIGVPKVGTISIEDFKEEADQYYDAGFGSPEVNFGLYIVGKDWWLERDAYDGSEWWEFKRMPLKPDEKMNSSYIWDKWGRS